MSQTPYVGAPQGAVWGFDPTTSLWLPVGISPKLVAANGEEYASLLTWVTNANPLGQQLSLTSVSIVPASDSPSFPALLKNAGWTSIYTTTQTGVASWAGSGDLSVAQYKELMINFNLTALTGTSVQCRGNRKDSFANNTVVWNPAALTGPGAELTSWGPGLSTNHVLGSTINFTLVLVSVTNMTFTLDVQGR